jgi:hypothetical protein
MSGHRHATGQETPRERDPPGIATARWRQLDGSVDSGS